MANLTRVDEYAKKKIDGVNKFCYTGHGVRLNASYISRVTAAGTGYDEDGNNPVEIFRIVLTNGLVVVTDINGTETINARRQVLDLSN